MKTINRFIKSFSYAFQGLVYTTKTQGNFQFHLFSATIVVLSAWFLHVSKTDWLILILCIGLVLFAELVNTALEALVDLVSPEFNALAKIVKDVAAAAVLVIAIMAAIIGLVIFIPYFL